MDLILTRGYLPPIWAIEIGHGTLYETLVILASERQEDRLSYEGLEGLLISLYDARELIALLDKVNNCLNSLHFYEY